MELLLAGDRRGQEKGVIWYGRYASKYLIALLLFLPILQKITTAKPAITTYHYVLMLEFSAIIIITSKVAIPPSSLFM